MATATKTKNVKSDKPYTIKQKTSQGEKYLEVEIKDGFTMPTLIQDKKVLSWVLENSVTHKHTIEIKKIEKAKQQYSPKDHRYLPSTDTVYFKQYEFISNVRSLIELAIVDFDISKEDAIKLGNDIMTGKISAPMLLPIWVADITKIKKRALECLYLRAKL